MPRGGRISIETAAVHLDRSLSAAGCVVPSGSYVRLVVADTNSRMSATTMEQIFDPFFTTKPEGVGTGSGRRTFRVLSRELEGASRWTRNWGAAHPSPSICRRDLAWHHRRTTVRRFGGNATGKRHPILVVDDEAGMREIVRRTLLGLAMGCDCGIGRGGLGDLPRSWR